MQIDHVLGGGPWDHHPAPVDSDRVILCRRVRSAGWSRALVCDGRWAVLEDVAAPGGGMGQDLVVLGG